MPAVVPAPGDLVWIRQRRWRVERAVRERGVVRLDVASRDDRLTFLTPFDRPALVTRDERHQRVRPQQAIARLAHLCARTHGARTVVSAIDADAAILPHQLEPALAILSGARRVLLADEVGLGKTVQAGLVIAEVVRRAIAPRILVVVPASLRDQWIDELRVRFRLACFTADREGLDAVAQLGARDDNPWRRSGVWIASLDYLKQPHVLDALPLQPWDLLVVDEAHDACGESIRHAACDEIARRSRAVLLLTATPHTGDELRFARLTSLGALDGVADPLTTFRRTRASLDVPIRRRVRWRRIRPTEAEAHLFQVLASFERTVLGAAGEGRREVALLLLSVLRKRALSSTGALAISLARRLEWLEDVEHGYRLDWVQPTLGFEVESSDDVRDDERRSLMADVGLEERQERAWIRRLQVLANTARRHESKIEWLARLLRRTPEPVAIFTEFRHSLEILQRRLAPLRSIATLHGGQTPAERREQLGRFLSGEASLLVATDVAGQGLNLQHRARWVVSFELPWNPARLEQRAGRVDRIGQTRPVHVTLLVGRHQAEAGVLERLARRTLTARRALGDVLAAAGPDERSIRATLIAGDDLDVVRADRPTVPLCGSWHRPARMMARRLVSCRAFALHWRGHTSDGGRPVSASLTRPGALRALADGGLLVFSVPLLDRSGEVLERHIVAIRVGRDLTRHAGAARALAATVLAARAARLDRRERGRHEQSRDRERAIARVLAALRCPDEAQPGLFDTRAARVFDAAREQAERIRREADEALADAERSAGVEVGRPALELVLTNGHAR